MKILILGATGLLGSWITPKLKQDSRNQIVTAGRSPLNNYQIEVSSEKNFLSFLDQQTPDIIFNLIAETNVDLCETSPEIARTAHCQVPKILCKYLDQSNAKLVHISTDHLYDGPGLKTESQIQIRNVYAETKYQGELFLKGKKSFIARTNFFGKSIGTKKSFSDWVIKTYRSNEPFQLFSDIYFSPVHWSTLYEALLKMIPTESYGTYNVGSKEPYSKEMFAKKIAEELSLKNDLFQSVKASSLAFRVPRPSNMAMDSSLFERTFKMTLPSLQEEIKKLTYEEKYEKI